MPEYDVLPEADSFEDRQRLADISRIYDAARNGSIPITKPIAGVLAASGLSMSVSAQPDRDDSYPEVGLVNDRVDGWADGVDASDTYVGQLGQGIENHGIVSGSVTLDPSDGNNHRMEIDGDTTINVGSVTAPKDGFSMSVLLESRANASLSWDSSITFGQSGGQTEIDAKQNLIVSLRTYDGGSTWRGGVQNLPSVFYDEGSFEIQWTPSQNGGSLSYEDDHLRMTAGNQEGGYAGFTFDRQINLGAYDQVWVDWAGEDDLSDGGTAELANGTGTASSVYADKSIPFSRTVDTFDISGETATTDFAVQVTGTNATARAYRIKMV